MKNFLWQAGVVGLAVGLCACGPEAPPPSETQESDITRPANPGKLAASPASMDFTLKMGTGDYAQLQISNTSEDTVWVDSAMLSAITRFTVTPMVSLPVALAPHGAPLTLFIGLDASYDKGATATQDTLDITPEHAASLRIPLTGTITE